VKSVAAENVLLRSESPRSRAQIFTLWQQATMEITCHDHPIIACSRHMYMGVILHAHPVRGEPHIQRNANREIATVPLWRLLKVTFLLSELVE